MLGVEENMNMEHVEKEFSIGAAWKHSICCILGF